MMTSNSYSVAAMKIHYGKYETLEDSLNPSYPLNSSNPLETVLPLPTWKMDIKSGRGGG